MATHSSILTWEIPWTEEPGRLQSHGVTKSQTWLSDFTFFHFHFLCTNRKAKVKVTESCPTLCSPMDCSPPGSSVYRILQAGTLRWVAISFSKGSSQPGGRTQVSCIAGRLFTVWATKEAHIHIMNIQIMLLSDIENELDNKSGDLMGSMCALERTKLKITKYLEP